MAKVSLCSAFLAVFHARCSSRTGAWNTSYCLHKLLLKMSPTLQGETLWRINQKWLRRVRFLAGTQPEFIAKVCKPLEHPPAGANRSKCCATFAHVHMDISICFADTRAQAELQHSLTK